MLSFVIALASGAKFINKSELEFDGGEPRCLCTAHLLLAALDDQINTETFESQTITNVKDLEEIINV